MIDTPRERNLKLRAYSPGKYPILAVELPEGELRLLYHETDYDLDRFKPAGEGWLRDNALGRHGFVEVDPPRELAASDLQDYVKREVPGA